jgi:hypothetical protein
MLRKLDTDVNSVLYRVDVGNIADLSEVHVASTFRIDTLTL